MKKNKDITPRNAKGQAHGLCVQYYSNDQLAFRCVFINGKRNAIEEWYLDFDGKLSEKTYYI